MKDITDVNEIKHLVCVKCGWGLPLIPRQKFQGLEVKFKKQHEGHPLTVLTNAELHDLADKRAELRKYADNAKSWAQVNKVWVN